MRRLYRAEVRGQNVTQRTRAGAPENRGQERLRFVAFAVLLATLLSPDAGANAQDCSSILTPLASPVFLPAPQRERPDLEIAAIELTGGFVADEIVYRSLASDVERIEQMPWIPVPTPLYLPYREIASGQITFRTTASDIQALQGGGDALWDCLATTYGAESLDVRNFSFGTSVTVTFQGIYDMRRLAAEYARHPSLTNVLPRYVTGFGGPGGCFPRNWLYINRVGPVWHYFYEELSCVEPLQVVHHVSSSPTSGGPEASDLSYDGAYDGASLGPPPDWWPLFEDARAGQQLPVSAVPSASTWASLLFALGLTWVAVRRLAR